MKTGIFILTGLTTILFVISFLLHSSLAQTLLARIAASYLSNKYGTHISIGKLDFSFPNSIDLKKLIVLDHHKDTLVFSGEVYVEVKHFSTANRIVNFGSVTVDSANFELRRYEKEQENNLQVFIGKLSGNDTAQGEKSGGKWDIRLNSLNIKGSSFSYNDDNEPVSPQQVDFSHLSIRNLDFSSDGVSITGDSVTAVIEHISLVEKSGFILDSLSGKFKAGNFGIIAENLKVKTLRNDLDLDLVFATHSFSDFGDFVNKVRIDADFRPSIINLSEVGYFAPVMYSMDDNIKIKGRIKGYVSNFKAKQFRFALGGNTRFQGNVQMNGLPDFSETFIHIFVSSMTTSAGDINNFKLPGGIKITLPEIVSHLGTININGKFTGFINDFVSDAVFNTGIGTVKTDIALVNNGKDKLSYVGSLKTKNFNAGKLYRKGYNLKKIYANINVVGEGATFEDMKVVLKGKVDSLEFRDYVYKNILVDGDIQNKKFSGEIKIDDNNVKFAFDGLIDYSLPIPAFDFGASIRKAKLYKLNISHRDPSMVLSGNIRFNFQGDRIDQMQGMIKLDSTVYYEKGKRYELKDFTLTITRDSTEYVLVRLFSDFAEASLEGKIRYKDLPLSVNNLLNGYLDTLFVDTVHIPLSDQDFVFDVTVKEVSPLTELFYPELQIAENSTLLGGYNSTTGNLYLESRSPEIIYAGHRFDEWYLDIFLTGDDINFKTGCQAFTLPDSLSLDSLRLEAVAFNDTVNYSINWISDTTGFGNIEGKTVIHSPSKYSFEFDKFNLLTGDSLWQITPDNRITIDTGSVSFENFGFYSNNQRINITGIMSKAPDDSLKVKFKDFHISNMNYFLRDKNIDVAGIVDGSFGVSGVFDSPTFLSDIKISGFEFNKEKLGDLIVKTTWDPLQKSFNILGQLIYRGNIGERKTLEIAGRYIPEDEKQNFDINIDLDNFKLKLTEPFLESFTSSVKGLASGHLQLTGTKEYPVLTGTANLMRVALMIDYIKVKYFFAEKVVLEKNKILFDNLTVYDSLNNKATGYGYIAHNYFDDFNIKLEFDTEMLNVLNTTLADNDIFYGKGFVSGKIGLEGPFDNIKLTADVKTEKGTMVYLPLNTTSEVQTNNFITFVTHEGDTLQLNPPEKKPAEITGFSLDMTVAVTYDANLQLSLPYQLGNIRSRGNGNIKMTLTPPDNFTMKGEYVVNKGSMFFTLQSIINRDFNLRSGSKIIWNGDPYDAQIDISAAYKVKTVLGEYGPIEDSATKVDVNCIINMKGKLLDPNLSYSLDFPYLKQTEKDYIFSRLDTTDQAMISQQFLSLLVMNNFYYSSGFTGSVSFNTVSLLTNQLNNILSRISDDFDIGVNYTPGSNQSAQEVELALSTQLFDNRVLINGNVGVKGKDYSNENASNFIGEVNVEVKLTDDGRWKAFAFNRSNNNLLYQNYSPYTQGIGLSYTKDFYKLSDLFKKRKKKKSNGETNTLQNQEGVNREVDNDDKANK